MTTTQHDAPARQADDYQPVDLTTATALIHDGALLDRPVGPVGLELEGHIHPLGHPEAHPDFDAVLAVVDAHAALPYGGRTTVEPGGQVEVSSGVHPDAATAIEATRAEVRLVHDALADAGLAWVHLGSDPVRASRRLNPAERYACMEAWFDAQATGAADGRTMMCSTAALQVNVEAGRPDQWADRVRRAARLGPLLTALTASSAHLAGHDTGLHSARQQAWSGLDPRVAGPLVDADDPASAWTQRALDAPVVHVPDGSRLRCADAARTLRDWLTDPAGWPPATVADVQRHLTTLFPPLRLRGFLELRCLDALPEPWWPAVAAAVVTWLDDDRAHAAVDDALAPVAERWTQAVADGLADPGLRAAAVACLDVAVDLAADDPRLPDLAPLRDLAAGGTGPGDLVADDVRRRGAAPVLEELAS